jgi:hypothetical protein
MVLKLSYKIDLGHAGLWKNLKVKNIMLQDVPSDFRHLCVGDFALSLNSGIELPCTEKVYMAMNFGLRGHYCVSNFFSYGGLNLNVHPDKFNVHCSGFRLEVTS